MATNRDPEFLRNVIYALKHRASKKVTEVQSRMAETYGHSDSGERAATKKVQKMLSHYKEGSSKRKLMEAFLKCSSENQRTPSTAELCKELQCTRANVSILKRSIAKEMQAIGITITSMAA